MSLGPANLGNLLVQRIDSALGVSQSAQNRTGAHPDALRQSQPGHRLVQGENQQRSTREGVDKSQQGRQHAVQGRQDPRLVSQQLQRYTDSRFTPSAPTTLGRTARTILALLTQFTNQPVQGQRPLFQPQQLAQLMQQAKAAAAQHTAQATPSGRAPIATMPTTTTQTTTANQTTQLNPQNTSPISTTSTLNSGPTALVNAFVQALSQNVQQSGMFYESHLAQLTKGQISPSQLQHQPQAQAFHQPQTAQPAPAAKSGETQQNQSPTNPTTTLQQSGVDPSTQQTVRQQLDVLANQLFTWRGEAWPGVPMDWEVRRHHEDEESNPKTSEDNEANEHWQTKIRLNLPRLGQIEARLHIEGKSLRMHIQAPAAADQLNHNLQQLVQRLDAQGLNVEQLQVVRQNDSYNDSHHEQDPSY